ncbi:hypothetical protein K438DRAFT_1955177 [Mycena galopus ATCC 62051]|nr:hypothetical protein K438DRAFT_1955177 [Mycena galopus ATCC 62051]
MKQHMLQVQVLQLCVRSLDPFVSEEISFSSLETLRLSAVDFTVSISDCVEMLRSAPLLVDCEFSSLKLGDLQPPLTQLLHTSLRHLRLGNVGKICSVEILLHLTLPALENLLISDFDIPSADFVSFLARSSPPLQTLHISSDHENLDNTYIPLIPRVTDLTLECLDSHYVSLLDETAVQDFPPSLRHLTIRNWFPSEYGKLISLLATRQLASLHIIFPYEDLAHTPHSSTVFTLRLFKKDGMAIHVGPKGKNYI